MLTGLFMAVIGGFLAFVMRSVYPNEAHVRGANMPPLLMLSAGADGVIPPTMHMRVFEAYNNTDKKKLVRPGGQHAQNMEFAKARLAMKAFRGLIKPVHYGNENLFRCIRKVLPSQFLGKKIVTAIDQKMALIWILSEATPAQIFEIAVNAAEGNQ